ncbi:MAG: exonuclease VII large subunit [Prevotella sp.]|jgi:myosin heavy subunit|nr:exonuclease VII large subunit [Prevotella sp.]
MPTEITVQQFKPSEIISILRNHLATGQVNQRVVSLRGIYFQGTYINQYFHTATDRLVDEDGSDELSILIPLNLRDDLDNGNVITVHGVLDRTITNKGLIQVVLKVTAVEKIKELAMSEDEIKRTELRRIKSEKGFKNVDSILESLLYQDKRPKVALIYAESSITNEDFEKGVQAARTHIDFTEYRESFARTKAFCQKLKQLDAMGFDVIAIIRGGGAGLEALDEVELLETLVNMNTAWMYGAGHEGEKLFILNIADKAIAIPHALGTYFRDLTDGVIQKRNNSRAALVKEVEGQFKKQIEDSNKKNQELTKQLAEATKKHNEQVQALTKAQTEATKKNKEQVEAIQKQHKEQLEKTNKQNEELQKKLTEITKANEAAQKAHAEQLGKLQGQMGGLNKSLEKLTAQNTQAAKDLNEAKDRARQLEKQLEEALKKNKGCSSGCLGMVAAIVTVASAACWIVCLIF